MRSRFGSATIRRVGLILAQPRTLLPHVSAIRSSSSGNPTSETHVAVHEGVHQGSDSTLGAAQHDDAYTREEAEPFDEVEASAQELHDITYAMIYYLRRADPDKTEVIMKANAKTCIAFRTPSKFQRGHMAISAEGGRNKGFATKKEFDQSTTIFLELGPKLMLHLTKDVMDRMLSNTRRLRENSLTTSLAGRRNVIERYKIKGFRQAAHYRHAPFEIQNLRSDIPTSYVDHSRALRDRGTISALMSLMEPQHPFREQLQQRMESITETYNPLFKGAAKP